MNHNWKPVIEPDDMALMCTECLSCQCCAPDLTDECPGEFVFDEEN